MMREHGRMEVKFYILLTGALNTKKNHCFTLQRMLEVMYHFTDTTEIVRPFGSKIPCTLMLIIYFEHIVYSMVQCIYFCSLQLCTHQQIKITLYHKTCWRRGDNSLNPLAENSQELWFFPSVVPHHHH